MIPDPSSPKIQRYSAAIYRSAGYMGLVVEHDVADDGPWVKWSDVEARLAQLAQEQATLKADVEAWRKSVGYVEAKLVEEHDEANVVIVKLLGENRQLEAALGETRQALQQLQEKYETLLSRVDTPGSADALVPQPSVGDTSTPSPVKEQER